MSLSPPATYSSSSTFVQPPGAARQVSTIMPIKLTKENYLLWKSLFISTLRASDGMLDLAEGREQCPPRFLTEEKESENPAYTDWIRRDQTLLTWINSSLSVRLLGNTAEFRSGRALWLHLETLLADKARTHVHELKFHLRNLNLRDEGHAARKVYFERANEIADGLEAAGSPVDDSEFVTCVLNGLPRSYYGFVASIRDRPEPVTRKQLQDSLIKYEPPSGIILGFLIYGFVSALILYFLAGISILFPIVLFVCLVLVMIWHIILSCPTSNMKLRAESA